ncbi:MAG TPA: adenylyl-sulfate kinase, partial [Pirellulales bacterium]|nr:adenylyl-sulfate kinase [Pirellulales bacterium]
MVFICRHSSRNEFRKSKVSITVLSLALERAFHSSIALGMPTQSQALNQGNQAETSDFRVRTLIAGQTEWFHGDPSFVSTRPILFRRLVGYDSCVGRPREVARGNLPPITSILMTGETHVTWHDPSVSRSQREQLHGHRGCVVWFTGLSGSGKSTVANLLDRRLFESHCHSFLLDGDNVRMGLNAGPAMLEKRHCAEFARRFGLGFGAQDREENIRRIGAVSR